MAAEKDLSTLLKTMEPRLNDGDYVFCTVKDLGKLNIADVILVFKEQEGITIVLRKAIADNFKFEYPFIAAWITLTIHSSLEAVGLTAAFSTALSTEGISCNVVAAFHHDHIFVDKKDAEKAMLVLNRFSQL